MTARCGSCDARIIWTVNAKTKARMPVNADPVPNGNIALSDPEPDPSNPRRSIIYSTVLSRGHAASAAYRPLHLSHHATCPNADQHRRKR